jgi:hypothetical protein
VHGRGLALLRRAEALAALGGPEEAEPLLARAVAMAHLEEAVALTSGQAPCPVCPTGFHVAAAGTCAAAGLPARARVHLGLGERHAGMWPTGMWPAAIGEARAAIALAEDDRAEAERLLGESADAFGTLGRPLDEARVRGRIAAIA